jgi:hypothetical protein
MTFQWKYGWIVDANRIWQFWAPKRNHSTPSPRDDYLDKLLGRPPILRGNLCECRVMEIECLCLAICWAVGVLGRRTICLANSS